MNLIDKTNDSDKACLHVEVAATDDFSSLSNFPPSYSAYGLSEEDITNIQKDVYDWVIKSNEVTEADRPINLPYFITVDNNITNKAEINTRAETYLRKGIIQNDLKNQLTERAFWQYFVPTIIGKYYDQDFSDIEITDEVWSNIDSLIYDLYTALKVVFADTVLDDNNNIVNYSVDSEIPVVRLNITYKYEH